MLSLRRQGRVGFRRPYDERALVESGSVVVVGSDGPSATEEGGERERPEVRRSLRARIVIEQF